MSNKINPILANNKTIVLIPPDKLFLKQFSEKRNKRISWNRESKYQNVIALNEWNKVAFLKYVILVPFLIFVIISFLIFLIFIGPYYYINKIKATKIFDGYLAWLNLFMSENGKFDWNSNQRDADKIICSEFKNTPYRVLYLHESQMHLLKRFDSKNIGTYLDRIWIYKHTAEIFERIINEEFQHAESKIIDFKIIVNNSIWVNKKLNQKTSYTSYEWVGNLDLIKSVFDISAIKSIDGKMHKLRIQGPRIRLNPNDFLNNEIVFYYESTFNEKLNKYLTDNYLTINEKLATKGMKLLYFPMNLSDKKSTQLSDLLNYVSYRFPYLFSGDEESKLLFLKEIFQCNNLEKFYATIANILCIPNLSNPCLIHSVEIEKEMTEERKYLYSIHEFTCLDDISIDKEITHYLELVKIPKNEIYFSLAPLNPDDPDDNFHSEGKKISKELQAFINNLKSKNDEKIIVDMLVFLIKKLEESQPDLCKQLNNSLFQKLSNTSTAVLSKLVIDDRYRIFLPDYNNIEIELNPLSKSLYIFLLLKPEGIRFKELSNYRKELIEIYSRVGNRLDMDQVKKSIYDLTDPRSNSINEKCSKIKEAFISKIDDSIAEQYYITGSRSQNKLIKLDRSLLIFPQTK